MFILLNACPKCYGNLYAKVDEAGAYLACIYSFCFWVGDAQEFGEDWRRAMRFDEEAYEE